MMILNGATRTAPKTKPGFKAKDKKDGGLSAFSGILENTLGQLAASAISPKLTGAEGDSGAGREILSGLAPETAQAGTMSNQIFYGNMGSPGISAAAGETSGFFKYLTDPAAQEDSKSKLTANKADAQPLMAGQEKELASKELYTAGNESRQRLQALSGKRRADAAGPAPAEEEKLPHAANPRETKLEAEADKAVPTELDAGETGEGKKPAQKDESLPAAPLKETRAAGEKEPAVLKIKVAEPYRQVHTEFSGKLSESVMKQMNAGVRSYEIQLEPEHLGKVEVRISVTEGRAVVELSCASHKTAEMLSENARTIGALMEQHSPNQVSVQVKQDAKPDWYQEQGNRGRGRERQQDENRDKKDREQAESGDFMEQLRLGLYKL